jgi:endonuclease/exonuclease/phosphatase (EEP) superfamily protein YafD
VCSIGYQLISGWWAIRQNPEPELTAPKLSLITEYPLPNGDRLLAVNVHLLTFERQGTMKLRSRLDEIKSIMIEHSGPIIVGADFNTWNERRLGLVLGLAVDLTASLPGLLWKST